MNTGSGRPDPNRRDFIRAVGGGATAVALSPLARAAGGKPARRRRPNVIYAFSDEHRWHSMSLTDMPQVKTPTMARLAAQGMSFVNAISNYPVCSPHRAILQTGRWPYQQGMIDNGLQLRASERTLGKVFEAAGYATGYIGKWHLGGRRAEPFGFDESLIWTGTSDHWKSTYHPKEGKPVVVKDRYNATAMTDQALRFIDAHRSRPFFLMLSWNPPHAKFTDPPEAKKRLYPTGSLPRRPNSRPIKRRRKKAAHSGAFRSDWPMYQGYHAHVSAIDDELARLTARLDELGLADDTIVVYSSDHGSLLGSHGVGGKRQPFEESIRVPFIIRWPGVIPAGVKPDPLFGSIDIMPSLCALAGLDVPPTCVGQDFSGLMRGGRGPRPASQFIMHICKKNASGGVNHPAPLFRGVRTERHTYAVYPDRAWCLFDNREDPYQMHNLIDDPGKATTRKEHRAMLAEWLSKADDPFLLPT